MSNTIAHIAVAKGVLNKRPDLVQNKRAYYLGALAPDAILGVPGSTAEDKKRVHLRAGIPDDRWFEPDQIAIFTERVQEFVREHIINETDGSQRDFNMGYIVHALTDKCNHRFICPKVLKKANEMGLGFADYCNMCVNDLEALDVYLLEKYPELGELLDELISTKAEYGLSGWIEKEHVSSAMWWVSNKYLPGIKNRKIKYITMADIEEFVPYSVEKILEELIV